MDSFLLVITENRGLIYAHVAVALLFLLVYSLYADKLRWSRSKVILFGGIYSLSKTMQYAWAISLSRLITVCYLAVCPDRMGLEFVAAIFLLTVAVFALTRDMRGFVNQLIIYAAILVALFLQGLFSSYYREVEGAFILKVFSVYLGCFAALYSVYQTLRGHERMIMLSGGASEKELETRAKESDSGLDTLKTLFKSKVKTEKQTYD